MASSASAGDETASYALRIQRLPRHSDRVLVLCQVALLRTDFQWVDPSAIDELFRTLRVPAPADVANNLMALAKSGLVVRRREPPRWSVTPEGRQRVLRLIGDLQYQDIAAELVRTTPAEFGSEPHPLVSPAFAPAHWASGIARMLKRFDFDRNVFCMTRLPKDRDDPVAKVITVARDALQKHGLVLHLASDRVFEDALLGNVAAYIWACKFGLGLAEDLVGEGLNYNLVAEVGAMEIAGRRCALLKDPSIKKLPSDVIGQIYKPVDFQDLAAVRREVHLWAAEDLGLDRCSECATFPVSSESFRT